MCDCRHIKHHKSFLTQMQHDCKTEILFGLTPEGNLGCDCSSTSTNPQLHFYQPSAPPLPTLSLCWYTRRLQLWVSADMQHDCLLISEDAPRLWLSCGTSDCHAADIRNNAITYSSNMHAPQEAATCRHCIAPDGAAPALHSCNTFKNDLSNIVNSMTPQLHPAHMVMTGAFFGSHCAYKKE